MQLEPSNNVVQLIPLERVSEDAERIGGLGVTNKKRRGWAGVSWSWLSFVIAPTIFATVYFAFFAADRFEVETQFVVRTPSASATSQIANLVQGSTVVRSADDAYIAHAYIGSRDAVRMLVRDGQLLTRLDQPRFDIFWRYPNWLSRPSNEQLWRHFQRFFSLEYDETTGISTLRVQAFAAEDAKEIADLLLNGAEALINRLNDRAQAQAVNDANEQVEASRRLASEALSRITDFRKRAAIIDPNKVSSAGLEIISRLALDQAQLRAQVAEIKKASPQSPQLGALESRITALDEQIDREHKALAGGDQSLAVILAEYEKLSLEREFAEKAFTSALAQLEAARLESERQRLFLERISVPIAPDYAKYPMRFLDILTVFLIGLMIRIVAVKMLADTRSHAER